MDVTYLFLIASFVYTNCDCLISFQECQINAQLIYLFTNLMYLFLSLSWMKAMESHRIFLLIHRWGKVTFLRTRFPELMNFVLCREGILLGAEKCWVEFLRAEFWRGIKIWKGLSKNRPGSCSTIYSSYCENRQIWRF